MIRLSAVIELPGQAPRALTHESSARAIVLGRDPTADFQIPLSTISRHHARLSEQDGVYTIEDLNSTHGTVVNGRKLGKGEKKVLRDGDVIELTKAKVKCTLEEQKLIDAAPEEGTKAIAAKAVKNILSRLGDAPNEGPYFRIISGPDEGQRFGLSGNYTEWHFGRSKDCEFVLNDPNVSRKHARVKKDWNGFTVEDLGSKNGVIVNDQAIKKTRRLKDRDEIIIGPVKLVFIDPDAELLEALKDVPGFAPEESSEGQPMDADPSHMGAPEGEAESAEPGGDQPLAPLGTSELDSPGSLSAAPMEDADQESMEIDPDLLQEEKSKLPVEWVVIGTAAVIILVCAVLLMAIVL